jgi:tetratricopeptide (TPR) repeat protein
MPIDVFISYRGTDRVLARRLEQRLRSRWGSSIFRDETSLMAGRPWSDQLQDAMADAKVMLSLVGPGWHVRVEGDDWVRDELIGAIEAGHPVLPVIVGDPDELAKRLTTLPEAFKRQAVTVSDDFAGFDMHKIEKALRDLGAFADRESVGQQLFEIVPRTGEQTALAALADGRSVIVSGASGSGRGTLLRRLVSSLQPDAARQEGIDGPDGAGDPALRRLVAACGVSSHERHRSTHRVVAVWVDGLCASIHQLPPDERAQLGPLLVKAVIENGPDLLARQVLRAASLLPLGDDDSDGQILELARRPTERRAAFPPERLVSQSISVLERFAKDARVALTLIVDHAESLDGSSKAVVRRLVESSSDRIQLVLATSAVRPRSVRAADRRSIERAVGVAENALDGFTSISLHDHETWGDQGAVVREWLDRHRVRLADGLLERFDDPNPYYALSALWYLVDNGHLVEAPRPRARPTDLDERPSDTDVVVWVPAAADGQITVPTRNQLLDHKVDEFIPIRFRTLISVGAMIGRRFAFSAAYAAACPPKSVDGEPPTAAAIERWRHDASVAWNELRAIDPDGSVISCHTSVDGERIVEIAQVDLVAHLVRRLGPSTRHLHAALAQYFTEPIGRDIGSSLDDRYTRAEAAAMHWAAANQPRHAADAEQFAAGLAEQALAYGEARDHYRRAIRLFTQLLARSSRNETVHIEDHQDLLILATCLYRLGQMTRLASERESTNGDRPDPTKYFLQALKRLEELSANLHDKRQSAPEPAVVTPLPQRDLPRPNVIRHHIRLCASLSGWTDLDLAEWHELCGDRQRSRELLFDALRHAESARGEADSRWLLVAASVRLAHQLVDDAVEIRFEDQVRAHNLAIEALYQIERVINLEAVSPDEDHNLDDPRARAWMVLGRIFQSLFGDPQLAEWAFRRMNEHRRDVSDLVDMMTDRQLGLFLLSRSRCGPGADTTVLAEARLLLDRHAKWATESGIDRERAAAELSCAVLALVEQTAADQPNLERAHEHVAETIRHSPDRLLTENAQLLRGVLFALDHGRPGSAAMEHPSVVEAFRAVPDMAEGAVADDDVLVRGWTTALVRLARVCPDLTRALGILEQLAAPDRSPIQAAIADDPRLQFEIDEADRYLAALDDRGTPAPSNDDAIWTLLRHRVARECYVHAERSRNVALQLVRIHIDDLESDVPRQLLERDVAYAIAVHEWYRSTDPSRLLTLAREANVPIDGAEWASPKLLSGRLALHVLDSQYEASQELGRMRFERIGAMVRNWALAADDAAPLEQLLFVAIQMSEPFSGSGGWHQLASQPGHLAAAYRDALEERFAQVRQAGLPIVQDLHLLDAQPVKVPSSATAQPTAGESTPLVESPLEDPESPRAVVRTPRRPDPDRFPTGRPSAAGSTAPRPAAPRGRQPTPP